MLLSCRQDSASCKPCLCDRIRQCLCSLAPMPQGLRAQQKLCLLGLLQLTHHRHLQLLISVTSAAVSSCKNDVKLHTHRHLQLLKSVTSAALSSCKNDVKLQTH